MNMMVSTQKKPVRSEAVISQQFSSKVPKLQINSIQEKEVFRLQQQLKNKAV